MGEGQDRFGEQACRLQEIIGNDGHENIELEVALAGSDADGGIIAHDLDGDHGNLLALGGIDLARHNGASGFIFRDADFTKTASGP